MGAKDQVEASSQDLCCPECGSEESGYFCRRCGALLHGGDMVLCPRCHQVVPDDQFCNQCGQGLGGIAVRLRQLALAGDTFWVTAGVAASPVSADSDLLGPDESVDLVEAELPDWLQDLSTESVPPDVQSRIYPSLSPIQEVEQSTSLQGRFLVMIILLVGLMLLGLVFIAVVFLLRVV